MGLAYHGTPCALILALLLAGCGNNEPALDQRARAPAQGSNQMSSLAQPEPANRFDGRWIGRFTLGSSSAHGCAGTHRRGMVVQNGVAAITDDRSRNSTATGEIQPDGRVMLRASNSETTLLYGRFAGGSFTGIMEAGGAGRRCHYAIEMTKRS